MWVDSFPYVKAIFKWFNTFHNVANLKVSLHFSQWLRAFLLNDYLKTFAKWNLVIAVGFTVVKVKVKFKVKVKGNEQRSKLFGYQKAAATFVVRNVRIDIIDAIYLNR